MSFVLMKLRETIKYNIINKVGTSRGITCGSTLFNTEAEESPENNTPSEEDSRRLKYPEKDRRQSIPVETSIRYLASKAYKESYGDNPVWMLYRRNHKGGFPPILTRKMCIRDGWISTGSPCPICRDKYLVLDHRNVDLLKQFISEFNGEILSFTKTGLCQRQHQNLLIAIHRAKDYGTITFDVPFREYDYSEWYNVDEIQTKSVS